MPRPGPRPYECVKRAWHSDRHRPMRGSIIQQIFRVVNERHSTVTKKNKEWQEKLPIVVLKAEEIMYSKANSEAEYMDLQSVWDRVNDAVDTIIRRDVSTESGDLLPPCVEAALHLGCVPVRVSRSQRHAHTQSYLSPKPQERPSISNTSALGRNSQLQPIQTENQAAALRPVSNSSYLVSDSNTKGTPRNIHDNASTSCTSLLLPLQKGNQSTTLRPVVNSTCVVSESNTLGMLRNSCDNPSTSCKSQLLPPQTGNQSTILRPVLNSMNLVAESNIHGMQRNTRDKASTSSGFPLPSAKFSPSSNHQLIPLENSIPVDVGSVYPVQYDVHFRPGMPQYGFQVPKNTNPIIVGTPVFPMPPKPAVMGRLQNLFSCEREEINLNKFAQSDIRNKNEKLHGSSCDLSLRLGFSEDSTGSLENIPSHDFHNAGGGSPKEADKSSLLPHQSKEFSFFPAETANDPFEFRTSHWNSEGEGQNARKRKATFNKNMEDGYFSGSKS